jgi:ribosomal-protein-alanine N-acetyltransferase
MVAECDGRVVGYMLYELHKNRLHVLNFAVAADMRRRGVGRVMASKLVGKLSPDRRTRVMLEVRETNLPAQLFFRACGFRAISVVRDFYNDSPEDAYVMQFRHRAPSVPIVAMPERITRLAG